MRLPNDDPRCHSSHHISIMGERGGKGRHTNHENMSVGGTLSLHLFACESEIQTRSKYRLHRCCSMGVRPYETL